MDEENLRTMLEAEQKAARALNELAQIYEEQGRRHSAEMARETAAAWTREVQRSRRLLHNIDAMREANRRAAEQTETT